MKPMGGRQAATVSMLLAGVVFSGWPSASHGAESIVTGGKTGTYYAIGTNLRDFVAPTLEVKDSKGSWANVEELSHTKGVTLAIVQSDVYSAFVQMRDSPDVAETTRREYGQLLANLRVFMPLYPEEIHFLVRKDDPAEFIHQIKGRQIWMDVEKSGTYLTALNIYGKMYAERPAAVQPFMNPAATGDDEGTRRRRSALMALGDPDYYKAYPRVDVVVLVGGQPLPLLEKSLPANLRLLKFDPSHPASARLLQEYRTAEIRKASYPLLDIAGNALPSLAVDSYLVTANFADPQRNQFVKDFAASFCNKVGILQQRGHAKWKSLNWQPGSPLPALAAGWKYSDFVTSRLSACNGGPSPVSRQSGCSAADRYAGLCK
jgi:hypothetical protein